MPGKRNRHLSAVVIKPTLIGSIQRCAELINQAHSLGLKAVISSSIESSLGLSQLARIAQQYTPNVTPGLDTLDFDGNIKYYALGLALIYLLWI